jgi:uncharacterized protein YdhG (YjbR/CyaY superfamily)
MKKVKNVDEYIKNAPAKYQLKLRQLRKVIQDIAPKAEETINYMMPSYSFGGFDRQVVFFGLQKHHFGVYFPPPIVEQHKEELKDYKITKAAIQFPLDDELPIALIRKLIKERLKVLNGK